MSSAIHRMDDLLVLWEDAITILSAYDVLTRAMNPAKLLKPEGVLVHGHELRKKLREEITMEGIREMIDFSDGTAAAFDPKQKLGRFRLIPFHLAGWVHSGCPVFRLPEILQDQFIGTDLGNFPFDDLAIPKICFTVSFEKPVLADGVSFDSVSVMTYNKKEEISFIFFLIPDDIGKTALKPNERRILKSAIKNVPPQNSLVSLGNMIEKTSLRIAQSKLFHTSIRYPVRGGKLIGSEIRDVQTDIGRPVTREWSHDLIKHLALCFCLFLQAGQDPAHHGTYSIIGAKACHDPTFGSVDVFRPEIFDPGEQNRGGLWTDLGPQANRIRSQSRPRRGFFSVLEPALSPDDIPKLRYVPPFGIEAPDLRRMHFVQNDKIILPPPFLARL